jgi:hypothetical protein
MFGKAVPKKNLIYNKFIILPRLLITTGRNEKEQKKIGNFYQYVSA